RLPSKGHEPSHSQSPAGSEIARRLGLQSRSLSMAAKARPYLSRSGGKHRPTAVEAKSNQQRLSHRVPMRQAALISLHTRISGATRNESLISGDAARKGRGRPESLTPQDGNQM